MSEHYVYVLFDWRAIPRYVGMGKGKRWLSHEWTSSSNWVKDEFIAETVEILGTVPKIKIAENLTRLEAANLETLLISVLGKQPNGPLTNIADGGGGTSGYCDRPEVRARVGQEAKQRWATDQEYREMMRSQEVSEKRTAAIRQSRKDPDYLQRASIAMKIAWAKKPQFWWTDGVEARRLASGDPVPEGWWRGRPSFSEEGRQSCRDRNNRRYADPEACLKHSDRMTEWWADRKNLLKPIRRLSDDPPK